MIQSTNGLSAQEVLGAGKLTAVHKALREQLGRSYSKRQISRICTTGRQGVVLPAVQGARREWMTTALAVRWWLGATSNVAHLPEPHPFAAERRMFGLDDEPEQAKAKAKASRRGSALSRAAAAAHLETLGLGRGEELPR